MSGPGHSGKRPTPCRFFTSGNCVYGDNCRNLHQTPPQSALQNPYQNGPHPMDDPGGPPMGGGGDQYFNATFNPAPGSNMNDFSPFRRGRPRSAVGQLSQSAKPFIPQGPMDSLPNDFAALNLASGMVKGGGEFNPVQQPSLPHSSSTPSFAALSNMFNQPPPTSTPVNHVVNNGGTLPFPSGLSPNHSPGISPTGSPHMFRRNPNPSMGPPHRQATIPQKQVAGSAIHQENVGGTTYFYNPDEFTPQSEGLTLPPFTMFHSTPAYLKHMKLKGPPTFFMADEIKAVLLTRQALSYAACDPAINPGMEVPQEVDNYDSLVPLERSPPPNAPIKSILGYPSTCYKATHKKEGTLYCLRRIHNFRLNPSLNSKLMTLVDTWNKLYHPNIVQLREAFTTKAFGDSSVVVSYDYLPGAETLMAQKFTAIQPMNGFTNEFGGNSRNFNSQGGGGVNGPGSKAPTETEIWSYIVQLCSALRCIHGSGLAARTIEPTKILQFGKGRLRVNCVGVMDILTLPTMDQGNLQNYIQHWQQEDLTGLGRIVLALACNSALAVQSQNFNHAMEMVSRNYSADLKNLIGYLFDTRKPRSVNDLMPMIGARFFTQLDHAQLRGDMLLSELSKEVENGRLTRLMMKLNCVLERAEFSMDPAWSETGDRYMLKLFRDYVFHAVDDQGLPWMDMSHMILCLNKLDAGVPEKIVLSSRDETSVFIVSYAELKRQFTQAFHELVTAGQPVGFT
ncbi:PAN2-PAN3 deadenylation complex subunit pan3-like isoform X2 [Littorina saxatilis]|uniref:PAN2-PAN3 deadenylation complex subunit pan3-like isoform X2 n=1 Tax=Littorina saxatilis TaxID=31220 RepID=UPI0038B4CA5C